MIPNEPNQTPETEVATAVSSSADDKRRAARRRFLTRGAAAGSGFFVVTLYHQRAFGWDWYGSKQILVSSPEHCQSLGGKAGLKQDVLNSIGMSKKMVTRYECDVPYRK